ncbi:MAG TPA: Ig-like domain-containing protein [Longimicrobiales bacterium]|nr:Ig-like domain-containing protein [Longimicrobiales bacterium]
MNKRFMVVLLVASLAACSADSSAPKGAVAAKVTVVSGTSQNAEAGQPLPAPLIVKVTDTNNQPVSNVLVSFMINSGGGKLSQALDTTDASGNASVTWTVGTSVGIGKVQARAQGVVAPVSFDVAINAGPPALIAQSSNTIGVTAGGFETADSIAITVTDNYNNPIAGQAVTFSVVSGGGAVSSATKSTGVDGVARTSWIVGNAGAQTLRATAGSLSFDVTANAVSCTEMTLAVGEVQSLNPANATCTILNGKAQRYFVTIVNPTNSPLASAAYKGRGISGTTSSQVVEPVAAPLNMPVDSFARTHGLILEKNMELLQRFGPDAGAAFPNNSPIAAQRMPPAVGDLIPMKLPDITINGCTSFVPVVGRVVYAGNKGIMLEDTATALKGQADSLYVRLGKQFDEVSFPILRTNFGDPLVMDAQLNNDGALYMFFSSKVNTMGNGLIAGFVNNADFLTTGQCPSSNRAEVFYARAPTTLASFTIEPNAGYDWARSIASTIIHEVKHLTSFGNKMAQPGFSGFGPQDGWLEESSAELAQELLSRVTFSYSAKSNVDYAATLSKEVRPSSGMPQNMFNAFNWLYSYLADPESRSLVGSAAPGDVTFYGSGWAFLRWAIDTYATSEPAFITAMIRDISHFGIGNIENLTGKPFQQLLSEFSLALVLDDYPGFTPTDAKYSFPSWNLRSMFAGLSVDFPISFVTATPAKARSSGFGKFNVDVGGVRGGGFSVLQLSGTQANKQLLEFKGGNGTAFPAELRVNIVRVQ